MSNDVVNRVRWWLSAALLMVAPLPFLGAIALLRVRLYPLWLNRGLNGAGMILPPLAGALGIMALASLLIKYPEVRWWVIPAFLLAFGGLLGLGGVFLKGSLSLVLLLLIPATGLISLGVSLSGLLNRWGMIVALTVVAFCSILFLVSLVSLLSILVLYLWPILGIGLLLRRREKHAEAQWLAS